MSYSSNILSKLLHSLQNKIKNNSPSFNQENFKSKNSDITFEEDDITYAQGPRGLKANGGRLTTKL